MWHSADHGTFAVNVPNARRSVMHRLLWREYGSLSRILLHKARRVPSHGDFVSNDALVTLCSADVIEKLWSEKGLVLGPEHSAFNVSGVDSPLIVRARFGSEEDSLRMASEATLTLLKEILCRSLWGRLETLQGV